MGQAGGQPHCWCQALTLGHGVILSQKGQGGAGRLTPHDPAVRWPMRGPEKGGRKYISKSKCFACDTYYVK
jgi:hypothetical protein